MAIPGARNGNRGDQIGTTSREFLLLAGAAVAIGAILLYSFPGLLRQSMSGGVQGSDAHVQGVQLPLRARRAGGLPDAAEKSIEHMLSITPDDIPVATAVATTYGSPVARVEGTACSIPAGTTVYLKNMSPGWVTVVLTPAACPGNGEARGLITLEEDILPAAVLRDPQTAVRLRHLHANWDAYARGLGLTVRKRVETFDGAAASAQVARPPERSCVSYLGPDTAVEFTGKVQEAADGKASAVLSVSNGGSAAECTVNYAQADVLARLLNVGWDQAKDQTRKERFRGSVREVFRAEQQLIALERRRDGEREKVIDDWMRRKLERDAPAK